MIAIPRKRSVPLGRILLILVLLLVVILAAVAVWQVTGRGGAPAPAANSPTRYSVEANARIVPVRWARLSATTAGRVTQFDVEEGQSVAVRDAILHLEAGVDTIHITSPFAGTVTSLPLRDGESALPGQTLAIVADLTRFQVETTDLDEYSVARVRVGQPASLSIDALEGAPRKGFVRSVAWMSQPGATGGVTYPVIITLDSQEPGLRWGMTVRVRFEE